MKIFLDDIRDPPDDTWRVVRSYTEFKDLLYHAINNRDMIEAVSLDHDLGNDANGTGYDAVCLLENAVHAGIIPVSKIGTITCHSSNPAGRQRIEAAIGAIEKRLQLL